MKYIVDITEVSKATVEVNAISKEEAEKEAYGFYYDGDVEWNDYSIKVEAHEADSTGGDRK